MVHNRRNRVQMALKPARGQALVEYALILVLLAVALAFAIAATGPAIGNVFCNVVDNLAGEESADVCGRDTSPLSVAGGAPDLFWATVTWIAGHPQDETPFPTPIQQPPTSAGSILQTNTPSPTPSITPTPSRTPTSTPTDTLTPSLTPSIGPSGTPDDFEFDVPHVDQISNPQWWRLDGGFWLGTGGESWTAQWYNGAGRGNCGTGPDFGSETLANPPALCSPTSGTYVYTQDQLSFNWGTSYPPGVGVTGGNTFGAIFTTSVTIAQDTPVIFTLSANNYLRLAIDGTNIVHVSTTATTGSAATTHSMTLTAGTHSFQLYYAEGTGSGSHANMSFSVRRARVNPDDSTASCPWGQVTNAQDSNSPDFQFDNLGAGTWTAGATCYLELRGSIDLNGVANPVLSFWDLWDLTSTTGTTASLQIAEYVTDVGGFFDRAAASWTTLDLHTTGSNYNWTRNEIPLGGYGGASGLVTLRFRLTSNGGSPFRWHLDDLQVTDEPLSADFFTIGDYWDLDTRIQMSDFLFNADTDNTLQNNPGLPQTTTAWRWDLTSTQKRGLSGYAWDQSPGVDYVKHSQGGDRVYFLEMKQSVDLSSPPAADLEGDTGYPMLSFWLAYEVPDGARITVEYTTDPRDEGPDTWTIIPNGGLLLNYTSPLPAAAGPNEQTARTNLVMQKLSIDLNNVPVQVFRLRFALAVQSTAASFGEGIYIDDIYLERESASPYFAYPFYDDAESDINLNTYWTNIGDYWGRTAELPPGQDSDELALITAGALSTGWSYSDSPNSNYPLNTVNTLELRHTLDLVNDTVENLTDAPGRPAASEPLLTFWHRRDVGSAVKLGVEMWTAASPTWTEIWNYNSATHATNLRRQEAWERIEINLRRALEDKAGATWATLASNPALNDDDIKIRFVFDTDGATDDGVYVDEISIDDANYAVFQLWPSAGGGDGMFVDYLDSTEGLGLPIDWKDRWHHGGIWDVTSDEERSGSLALAAGPGSAEYMHYAEMFLELSPIIDLTSTPVTQDVRLYFWTRYNMSAASANIRVEIASEAASESPTTQYYGKMGGWNAWTEQAMTIDAQNNVLGISNNRVNTWGRAQVNLTSYIGQRIRLRFSLESTSTNDSDAYIDDISLIHGLKNKALIFTDNALGINNWVPEGNWGLTEQYFVGTGASVEDLGPNRWIGWFFDCEGLGYGTCDSTAYELLVQEAVPAVTCPPGSVNYLANAPVGPECVSDIDMFLGYDQPGGTPLGGLAPEADFHNTWAARWTRQVTLKAGETYRVETVSDDGIRLSIDNVAGTDIAPYAGGPTGRIIDRWNDHGAEFDTATFTVTSGTDITRTLTLDFYENSGTATVYLAISQQNFSFTDSPNTFGGATWTAVDSTRRGDSALILDGYFDFTGRPSPVLSYNALYDLGSQTTLYVEVSGNGGFTWSTVDTVWGGSYRDMTSGWESRSASLAAAGNQTRSMIRFRLDARTATDASMVSDGMWISGIQVN